MGKNSGNRNGVCRYVQAWLAKLEVVLQVPLCEEKSVQLVRVAFFQSDFLQNPYFSCFFAYENDIQ